MGKEQAALLTGLPRDQRISQITGRDARQGTSSVLVMIRRWWDEPLSSSDLSAVTNSMHSDAIGYRAAPEPVHDREAQALFIAGFDEQAIEFQGVKPT